MTSYMAHGTKSVSCVLFCPRLKVQYNPTTSMKKEIEATFLSINKEKMRAALNATGYVCKHPEYLMRRKTFDFSTVAPGKNKWGRVRQEVDKATMTVKEVLGAGINDTFELEMTVDSFDSACEMFEQCGIHAKSFQENYREVWEKDSVQVTIDTWPGLNPFVEVEATDASVVKDVSTRLGLDFSSALFGSIDLMYEKELGIPASTIITLPEITFANPPKR